MDPQVQYDPAIGPVIIQGANGDYVQYHPGLVMGLGLPEGINMNDSEALAAAMSASGGIVMNSDGIPIHDGTEVLVSVNGIQQQLDQQQLEQQQLEQQQHYEQHHYDQQQHYVQQQLEQQQLEQQQLDQQQLEHQHYQHQLDQHDQQLDHIVNVQQLEQTITQ